MYGTMKLLMILYVLVFPSIQENVKSEITFCNFEVPAPIKRANASFYVTYSFELDDDGKPAKFSKVRDDYIGEDKVARCLGKWQFRGLSGGTTLVSVFRWQHGLGWVSLTITGKDFFQKIQIEGDSYTNQMAGP
jgi:hypothetical protein